MLRHEIPTHLDVQDKVLFGLTTRQTMHAEQIEQAAEAGVGGILCDKPLATSLDEVDRILAACRRAHLPLAFGLDRRWTRRYRWARTAMTRSLLPRSRAASWMRESSIPIT